MSRISSRSAGVALASAALVGLSSLALPGVAGADEATCDPTNPSYTVEGGSIEWGFKQSFRSYFYGQFAGGEHTLGEGAGFKGSETGADGRWTFEIDEATVNSKNSATASSSASVQLVGHHGALDTTLSNPVVEINGTNGVLKIDYAGKKMNMDPNAEPVPVGGEQVVAATFTLPSAANFQKSGTVTVTSSASVIGDDFVPAFNNYPSGSSLDPVTLILNVSSPCGDTGGDDNSASAGSLGRIFNFGS